MKECETQSGLNFRGAQKQAEYFAAYDESLKLIDCDFSEKYVETSYGDTHVICCGDESKPPLVLIHAASCGSPIWYKNLSFLSERFSVYAIDLITECSKSILKMKVKKPVDNSKWLNETLNALKLEKVFICGISIGGWTAANYAGFYPGRVMKLVLLSPVQTFAKMYKAYFFKIMKMGFKPTKENVENYIGWGSEKEENPLPDSIIKQFTLSVMNMNSNASFPRWLKKEHLQKLNMPVLTLFGENEFAFPVKKALKRTEVLSNVQTQIVGGASHLLCVSKPDYINERLAQFFE